MILTFLLLSSQNLVVNGDFENNTSSGCDYDLVNSAFNARMVSCNAYGTQNELDIMDGGSCAGPAGPVGSTKLGLATDGGASVDALVVKLSNTLIVGQTYTVKAHLLAQIERWAPLQLPIEIGVTTNPSSQGTVIATFTPSIGGFAQFSATFTATVAANYVSIQAAPNVSGWTHVDGVELSSGGTFALSKAGTCPGVTTLGTTGGTPSSSVAILYGSPGSRTKPSGVCAGTTVSLANPTLAAVINSNAAGSASLSFNAPAGACGRTVQAVDLPSCAVSNTVVLQRRLPLRIAAWNFSSPRFFFHHRGPSPPQTRPPYGRNG